MQHFVHDNVGCLRWLAQLPGGFVMNTYSRLSAAYLKLHLASCASISRLPLNAKTFTDGDYSKLCGERSELELQARHLGGTVQPCPFCL
jgi:hypothetical protein